MKSWILVALTAWPLIANAAEKAEWKLVWSDEFDQTGQPDTKKWSFEKGLVRNNEKQFYTENRPENARIEEGKLIIEARKEKREGADFTSASLISKSHGEWKYGRFEVRAKLPAARGTWPAIWMLPVNFGSVAWPKCGEIDIMEHVGYDPNRVHGTLHTEAFNHIKGTQKTSILSLPTATEEFHIYSVEWSADRIAMSIDGKSYATYDKKPTDGEAEWPFDKPFYLILNLAVGGSWGGIKGIDETSFPQKFEIDYVRIYQLTEPK